MMVREEMDENQLQHQLGKWNCNISQVQVESHVQNKKLKPAASI